MKWFNAPPRLPAITLWNEWWFFHHDEYGDWFIEPVDDFAKAHPFKLFAGQKYIFRTTNYGIPEDLLYALDQAGFKYTIRPDFRIEWPELMRPNPNPGDAPRGVPNDNPFQPTRAAPPPRERFLYRSLPQPQRRPRDVPQPPNPFE